MDEESKAILSEIAAQLRRQNDLAEKRMAVSAAAMQSVLQPMRSWEKPETIEGNPERSATAFKMPDFGSMHSKIEDDHREYLKELTERSDAVQEKTDAYHSALLKELRRIADELKRISDLRA